MATQHSEQYICGCDSSVCLFYTVNYLINFFIKKKEILFRARNRNLLLFVAEQHDNKCSILPLKLGSALCLLCIWEMSGARPAMAVLQAERVCSLNPVKDLLVSLEDTAKRVRC